MEVKKIPQQKRWRSFSFTPAIVIIGLLLLVFLSGCNGSFDAGQTCKRILGVSDAPVGQTIVGAICSGSLKQKLSSQEISAIEKTKYAGILTENSLVEFSCTIKNDFLGAKSYALDYLFSSSCGTDQCTDQSGAEETLQASCNAGKTGIQFCERCNDKDPCTIDQCLTGNKCSFIPRCPNSACNNGSCEFPNPCGNGICEANENFSNCPTDCKAKTECSDGGFTGADAAPRNKFAWTFSSITANECDAANPNHVNCDMTQFLIAFFQKMHLAENQWQTQYQIDKVGNITRTENGFDLEFDAAFLSDNLSYQLLWDFKRRESGFFDEPSWFREEWNKYLMTSPNDSPILIEYKSPSLNWLNAIHEAGIYHARIETRFNSPENAFFTGSGNDVQPNATIKIVLERTGSLTDTAVLDLALNGDLGSNNAWKDYGVQWEQRENQTPTSISFTVDLPSSSSLDSSRYKYGLGFVSILETESGEKLTAPAFFHLSTIPASLEEPLFFNESPVLLQTIENSKTTATPSETAPNKDREYGLLFQPATATPLLAFVSSHTSIGLGVHGGTANQGFLGPWISITDQATNCENNNSPSLANEAVSCGETGPASPENGLLLQNKLSNSKLYFNLAYTDSTNQIIPMIELCNSGAEITTLSDVAGAANQRVQLSNETFRIRSIQEVIEGIKANKICVNAESVETPAEDTQTGSVFSTITKTTYTFNTQALFNQIKPRLDQHMNNSRLGPFTYCG